MLLIIGDVETLDNRCADPAQLIHDDRVPLLPARREHGPRRSLNVSDLIAARHRPSRYRMHPPNTKALLGGRREYIMPDRRAPASQPEKTPDAPNGGYVRASPWTAVGQQSREVIPLSATEQLGMAWPPLGRFS